MENHQDNLWSQSAQKYFWFMKPEIIKNTIDSLYTEHLLGYVIYNKRHNQGNRICILVEYIKKASLQDILQ